MSVEYYKKKLVDLRADVAKEKEAKKRDTRKSFQKAGTFDMEEINLPMKVLPVIVAVCGIMIFIYWALNIGGVPMRFVRKKWQKKLEGLFKKRLACPQSPGCS